MNEKQYDSRGLLALEKDAHGQVIRYRDITERLREPQTELCEIALRHRTDKCGNGYTTYYHSLFSDIRYKPLNILEIGISAGYSLTAWSEYFPKSMIYGIDAHTSDERCRIIEMDGDGWIKCFRCDQGKRKELLKVILQIGKQLDIIIDDGSHYQYDQQISLGTLFPYLKSNGYYIIEDMCKPGNHWGHHDLVNYSDNTCKAIADYQKTGSFESMHLTENEALYLSENIGSVQWHFGNVENRGKTDADYDYTTWGSNAIICILKKSGENYADS